MLHAQQLQFFLSHRALLEDVDLTFESGFVYGIMGPNGAGKSTLLKNLSGIWMPTSGSVLWKGKNLLTMEREEISRTVSMVPQQPSVLFEFTVEDLVAMGRYPHGRCRHHAEDQGKVDWALKQVDALGLRDCPVRELSHGERQRVYIARALVTESPVILLDEPTASLDLRHQMGIWFLVRELAAQGKVVLVVLHDLEACQRFCDRVVLMKEGRCIAAGDCKELLQPHVLHDLFDIVTGTTEVKLAMSDD